MKDLVAIMKDNEWAVLREFREAVEDGAIALARRIWEANPDLHEHFREVTLEDRP